MLLKQHARKAPRWMRRAEKLPYQKKARGLKQKATNNDRQTTEQIWSSYIHIQQWSKDFKHSLPPKEGLELKTSVTSKARTEQDQHAGTHHWLWGNNKTCGGFNTQQAEIEGQR